MTKKSDKTKITRKSNNETKNNDKLKLLKNLRPCTVRLRDIALDKDLVQFYQLHLLLRKTKSSKHTSSINTFKSSNNVLKEIVQEDNTSEDKISYITKRNSTKLAKKESKNVNFQLNSKNIGINRDISLHNQYCEIIQSDFIHLKQELQDETSIESFSSKNYYEPSTSSSSYYSQIQKSTVSKNNKKLSGIRKRRKKLNWESKKSCKKTAILNQINTDIKQKSSINKTAEDIKLSFKSLPMLSENTFISCDKMKENQNQKDANKKSSNKTISLAANNMQKINASESFDKLNSIYSKTSKIDYINKLPDLKVCIEKQCIDKIIKTEKSKNLPIITDHHILPQGMVKILKKNSDESLQSSVSEQISLKQNDVDSNTKQILHTDKTLKSTNILGKKDCYISKLNESIDKSKVSKSIPNNNIDMKDKNLTNGKLHHKVIDDKILNSLKKIKNDIYNKANSRDTNSDTTENYENYTSKLQEQSNKLDNDRVHDSNKLQDKLREENKLQNKEKIVKQGQKRIAEENTTDTKQNNKKRKLNRTNWQHNLCFQLINKQLNDVPKINTVVTAKSNISKKSDFEEDMDLREYLNKKDTKQFPYRSTFGNKFNNGNNAESEQTNLNNKSVLVSTGNIKKRVCRRLSFEESTSSKSSSEEEEKDYIQKDSKICNDQSHHLSTLQNSSEKTQHANQLDTRIHKNTNIQQHMNSTEDDDCISLFAESFDTTIFNCFYRFEKTLSEEKKPYKFIHSDLPYMMTAKSFDQYVKKNATEFNKEYAKCIENSTVTSNKIDEVNKVNKESNDQKEQIMCTEDMLAIATTSKLVPEIKNEEISKYQNFQNKRFFSGYCFSILRKNLCYNTPCIYGHDLQYLINRVCSQDFKTILDIIQEASYHGFCFFYETLLSRLTVDQILITYQTFYNRLEMNDHLIKKKKSLIHKVIKELINKKMSLRMIVNHFIERTATTTNNLIFIFTCIERYVKCGEYWNTLKPLILRLPSDKYIIVQVLMECIKNEKIVDIQDINDNLISKTPPEIISTLDKNIIERFKNLLTKKTAESSHSIIQNFGENLASETIASPDGSTNSEHPICNDTFINEIADEGEDCTPEIKERTYIMRFIDNLPEARSVYRDHEHLWKFYVDLDRFKKGLEHKDYDYVIDILKKYVEKQNETPLFIRSCCNILRKEVTRSEYHLANIIRRTVQLDVFNILGKILFDIGLNILTNLVDKEAWGLALWFIQSLKIYDLPYNAQYFLLSAEIYLANKKAVEACDLLKNKNIIYTSRDKWYVKSTINDEYVRSKIMLILLDSFCSEFVKRAFFLFQFLLKDQSSQYYPIDLSRYVDKLIILILLNEDKSLIIEMANLILKYTFMLSTKTCRALTSTLIHVDENIAKQIYNYAEGLGIYSTVKLWPITYIIINSDLTEEEIYLAFSQLLKIIVLNCGHAIEFTKQIRVYFIMEVKLNNKQFYSAEWQTYYNNKVITNTKTLIRNVLKKRFDPPILLMKDKISNRMYKLQSKSLINYLKTEHCN
ncbi:hypothetical protein P5V15_005698 [Pogonomyrmex californicus]